MRKCLLIGLLVSVFTAPASAYDKELAKTYEQFFSTFEEKMVPKALHRIPADQVVEAIKKGEDLVIMDVRTKAEQSMIGLTYKNTLNIPMNEVFKEDNLRQIPTDKRIVVTCKQGLRCTIIALALRNIGFDNVYAMKGGLVEMMKYLSPETAF